MSLTFPQTVRPARSAPVSTATPSRHRRNQFCSAEFRAKGDLAGAEPLYLRALSGQERGLGEEHPTTLLTVLGLAGLRQAQGKLDAAEGLALRAEAGLRAKLGGEHPHTKSAKSLLEKMRKERAEKSGGK